MKGQDVIKVKTSTRGVIKNGVAYSQGKSNKIDNIGMEVHGLDELFEDLMNLGDDAIFQLSEPSIKAANVVLEAAKAKVSVDNGDLQRALKVTAPGRKRGHAYQVFARVGFGKGASHGVALELGHKLYSHNKEVGAVKERPFLRPAADESAEKVADIITNAINNILEEFGAKDR